MEKTLQKKPTLLIMAAGVGSRYGSLKQLDRFGPSGETLIEYAVYDALRAGLGKIVFVIRKALEKDFNEVFFSKLSRKINLDYVFQEINLVPDHINISASRTKPWGTGHAVWVAADKISEPFAVINGDDFYGASSFQLMADELHIIQAASSTDYCMIGYPLDHTLSEHGYVSRGICEVDENNYLQRITERTQIAATDQGIIYKNNEGQDIKLTGQEIASMNLTGFTPTIFNYLGKYFEQFLYEKADDLKAEFYLPGVVNHLIQANQVRVKVRLTAEKWFGVTYPEDKAVVIENINSLVKKGIYPDNLWA